ncbi:MAG: hypothetical protein HUU01_16365, partial [Saprospiraceae bacterium]|nr:hypothetical protein [Saprospiraceae bacterium]
MFVVPAMSVEAQTFNGQGGLLIPPGAPAQTVGITQSPCTVSGVGTLGGCLQIANVTIDINHTFVGDVGILLIAPNGSFIDLTTGNGGGGDNWTNCVFSDQAGAFITTGFPPYTGTWRPEGRATTLNQPYSNANPLGTFTFANTFNGINADGVWNLYVNDYVFADVGIINSWSITFTDSGTPPPAFPASISACPGSNGLASFNLTTLNETVNGGTGLPVTYYLNSNATSPIGNPANFQAPASTTIYAVVMGSCPSAIVPITVTVTPASLPPGASVTIDPPTNCGPIQGTIVFNLGIPGPVNITYSISGSTTQNFSGTTNAAGTLTISYPLSETVTATLLTAVQPGGCSYSFPPISDQFVLQQGPTITFNGPNIFCEGQTLDLNTFVTSNGALTFHTGNPPTPGNQLSNPIVVLQNTTAYYAFAQAANGCTITAFVPLNVTPGVTPVLSPATICENSGAFNLVPLQNPAFPNGVWSGPGVTGTTFNPLGLVGTNTLTFTPSSGCALPATTTVTVVPSNTPMLSTTTICSAANPLNLTTLQDPAFPNGTWSGPGVSGNTFNPAGFSGPISLVFTPSQNCAGPATTQVVVQAGLQPVLGTVTLCNTDAPINLNTLADPTFPSSGVWTGPGVSGIFFNPANLTGPVALLFTPTGPGCFIGSFTIVQVNEGPIINLGQATICENAGLYDLGLLEDPNFPNGVWSGPGVIGGNFDPDGQTGVNTLTFTPNVACGGPVTTTIVVSPVPAPPVLGVAELCANATPFNLTALQDPNFPSGVWSGPGVIGSNLNPANLSGTITLTFASNQACVSPVTTTVQITPVVQPVLGSAEVCPGDPPLSLIPLQDPAFPVGTWSGPGVGGSFFNPTSLAGQITLVFTPQGVNCAVAASTIVEVTVPPAPLLASTTLCESGGTYNLGQLQDPGFPTGTWSGPGVTGNSFNPQGLPGINTLTFTPGTPCTASATTTITVSAPVTPSLATATVCSSDAPLNLASLLSPGTGAGLWSGPGVSGGQFAPAGLSGPVVLTFTPSGVCTAPATTTLTVTVTEAPVLATATLCQNSGPFNLSVLTPPGFSAGTWSGTGVTANQLDPGGLSGDIVLTFTPSGACALPGNTTITINASAPPSFTTQFSGTLCPGDCLEAAPSLTGEGPFNLIFEITGPLGSALDTLQIANSGATISICPFEYALGTGAYTLTALEISDANCQQPLNLPLGAFQTVAPMSVLSTTLCAGEELTVGNQTFNTANPSGTVTLTGASANGCDSLVQVSLSFFAPSTSQLNQTLCNGESLT